MKRRHGGKETGRRGEGGTRQRAESSRRGTVRQGDRMRFEVDPQVGLRDRYRGAEVGGATGPWAGLERDVLAGLEPDRSWLMRGGTPGVWS